MDRAVKLSSGFGLSTHARAASAGPRVAAHAPDPAPPACGGDGEIGLSDSPRDPQPEFNPLAALLNWLLPGAGHISLGQPRRGLIIGIAILATWCGGLLIGGLTVIDHLQPDTGEANAQQGERQRSLWFAAQILMAPSLAAHQLHVHNRPPDEPDDPAGTARRLEIMPSLGHVYEQGQLLTALAGMLNLLAILDVIYTDPRRRREAPLWGRGGAAGAGGASGARAIPRSATAKAADDAPGASTKDQPGASGPEATGSEPEPPQQDGTRPPQHQSAAQSAEPGADTSETGQRPDSPGTGGSRP